MHAGGPSTAKEKKEKRKEIQGWAFFCLELLILEPGSIRKGADLENGVKIALVELCQHELFDSICCTEMGISGRALWFRLQHEKRKTTKSR